jgi:hypothetical protein
MVTAPVRIPVAVGLKVTLSVQKPAGATVPELTGQSFVWAKSPLFIPVIAMFEMLSGASLVLVRVTLLGALVVPIA